MLRFRREKKEPDMTMRSVITVGGVCYATTYHVRSSPCDYQEVENRTQSMREMAAFIYFFFRKHSVNSGLSRNCGRTKKKKHKHKHMRDKAVLRVSFCWVRRPIIKYLYTLIINAGLVNYSHVHTHTYSL